MRRAAVAVLSWIDRGAGESMHHKLDSKQPLASAAVSGMALCLFACGSSGASTQAPAIEQAGMSAVASGGAGQVAAGAAGAAPTTGGTGGQHPSAGNGGAGSAANAGGGAGGLAAGSGGGAGSDAAGTNAAATSGGGGASGVGAAGSAGAAGSGTTAPRTMQPIDPPVADDCIKDVTAGDKTFTCSGLTFLVMVDPMCIQYACGVIFDIHGATMSGFQMRNNTLLYKIAPPMGYIVVNPSATADKTGGTWDLTNDPPKVADFFDRTIKAYHIDPARIHVGGFSQGSAMTFWFLQNHHDAIASAAPVSGATDVAWMTDSWQPRIPIFYENGTKDQASMIDSARTMVDNIVSQLMLTGGMEIAGDGHYSRKHWEGSGGMLFDYIEHDYGGQAVLDGHCIPGGVDTADMQPDDLLGGINATTCTTGDIQINWGQLALQWYIDHPKTM
jgi:pimeloyl-ACP methyl ester carboxylesterase